MKYETNIPEYQGGSWNISKEFDAESAAEVAGQEYNENGDYALMQGDGVYVRVREVTEEGEPASEIQVFYVTAEADIKYYCCECESEKCKQCGTEMIEIIKTGKVPYAESYCNLECYKQYRHEKYGCPK